MYPYYRYFPPHLDTFPSWKLKMPSEGQDLRLSLPSLELPLKPPLLDPESKSSSRVSILQRRMH